MMEKLLLTLFILVSCTYTDWKYKKIKNYLTFPLIFSGVIINFAENQTHGLLFSLQGMAVMGVLLLVIPGFGMGDVKLFMGIGAMYGFAFGIDVLVFTCLAVIVAMLVFSPARFKEALLNIYRMVSTGLLNTGGTRIPFAMSTLIGFIVAILLGGDLLWLAIN